MFGIGHHEEGVGLTVAAAHPAPQLIELAKAEQLGLDPPPGYWHGEIQPRLDDGRTDQHIQLAVPELVHVAFQLAFRHLAVRHAHPGGGHQLAHILGHALQALHPVVDPEDLAFPGQLAFQDRAQGGVVTPQHGRGHRLAILRGGLDDGKVADAGHGKLQGARDGRGRQGQHVHILFQGLELSLCRTPKRCSSSRMSRERLGRETSDDSRRCVPSRMSIAPRPLP